MRKVVVLGAGFAGLTLAERLDSLAGEKKVEVSLIEGAPRFQMGLAAQGALASRRGPDGGAREYKSLRMRHVRFIHERAESIDVEGRSVRTALGSHAFDDLVVATGAELAPELVPGLAETAHNLCDMASVLRFKEDLEKIRSGTVTILVAGVPFKCPPAPYEYALLADEILEERGVRNRCSLVVATPEPQPMPSAGKAVGDTVRALLESRQITCRFNHKVKEIRRASKSVAFEDGSYVEYSVLAAMPPHRAPKVVREAGLCDASGFVPVDLKTLRTATPGIFAVGDVASLKLPEGRPHPKAGVFAEAQAAAVAETIRSEVEGGGPGVYGARGACFFDVGHGQAAAADLDLLAEGGPRAHMGAPSKEGLEAKAAFEAERLARWFA
jgi:sulfide:quinone oxidoreductase